MTSCDCRICHVIATHIAAAKVFSFELSLHGSVYLMVAFTAPMVAALNLMGTRGWWLYRFFGRFLCCLSSSTCFRRLETRRTRTKIIRFRVVLNKVFCSCLIDVYFQVICEALQVDGNVFIFRANVAE